MYETILFDLDGTLTDPAEGITNSVAYALRKYGIEPPERRELYCFIGPPLADSFRKYYGFSEDEGQKAVEVFREYFRDRGIFENVVYDGTSELLAKLKTAGKTVVLATSKPEPFARQILERFDLAKYFDRICGATMDTSRTNKEAVIAYLLEQNQNTGNIIMVGDTKFDVIGAKAHNIPCVGVSWGYGEVCDMLEAGAVEIAHSAEELFSILQVM